MRVSGERRAARESGMDWSELEEALLSFPPPLSQPGAGTAAASWSSPELGRDVTEPRTR